jgi:rhomboid protease GluP
MALDQIFWWAAVVSTVVLLVRLAQRRFADGQGWAVMCVLVLAAACLAYGLLPDQAGLIAITLWLVLLGAPLRLAQLSARRTMQQRFAAARLYASCARLLHPLDGLWLMPAFIDALILGHRGETDEAAAILTRLQGDPRASERMQRVIRAQVARFAQDWPAILALTEDAGKAGSLLPSSLRLRAFGETMRLHELVAAFRTVRHSAHGEYQLCLLFLFAFCGRRDAVAHLVAGPLASIDSDTKQFWLATAELAAGAPAGAAQLAILAAYDRTIRFAARHRLDAAIASAAGLDGADRQVVDEAEAAMRLDAHFRDVAYAQWWRSYVVMVAVALNLVAFAAEEFFGGSESAPVLYRLGAVWPASVAAGEWWRLLAASFLHAGPLHLAVNMLALGVIGPWVEWMLGHWRLAVIYLGSAIGSMAAVQILMQQGLIDDGLLVGASGAIFGVVGAQIVLLLRGFRRLGSRLAGRRLAAMGLVIAVQVVFDLTTPQVSFSAHASGFLIGIALTLLVDGRRRTEDGAQRTDGA